MTIRTWFVTAAALTVVSLSLASPASADFKMRLDVGNNGSWDVEVTDNGAGDSDPTLGVIVYSQPVAGFTVSINTGLSKPILPTDPATLHLNSVEVTTNSGGTLAIELTDTDFSAQLSTPLQILYGGLTGGSVTFTGAGGNSNDEFDLSNSTTFGPVTGAFSGVGTTPNNVSVNPFSMTLRAVIVHGGGSVQTTSFDAEIKAVPAPAGALLLVAGAPLLAFGAWRRKAAQAV